MKKIFYTCAMLLSTYFAQAQTTAPDISPTQTGLVGLWSFDNSANLLAASKGAALTQGGTATTLAQVAGPSATDFAVRKTLGTYLKCVHGIAANGGSTTNVNQYSLVIDFKVPDVTKWRSFMQTNLNNTTDGDMFVNTSGQIGISALTYSTTKLVANEWYRLVISANVGTSIKMYIDGQLWNGGAADVLNGKFSLDKNGVLLFADDNAEDNTMDIANVAVFNKALTENEIFALSGYGHAPDAVATSSTGINPYLQTPTPTSMYVSWHCKTTTSTFVKYGTSKTNLNLTTSGTNKVVNGGNVNYVWHTVKLTNLTPDTEYFYRCFSGNGADSTTTVYAFRTPALPSAKGQHIRFLVLGDSRTDVNKTTSNMLAIKNKLTQMYGPDLHNHIDLICNVGDVVTDGSQISQYTNEYFTPYAPLTHNIPNMISIGNHEGNSAKFYDYMKYEDLTTGYAAPHPYNEKFYQFSLGNVQFMFLNANTAFRISDQTKWLELRLRESEGDTSKSFVFSFTHQPGHSEIWPDGNEAYTNGNLIGLLTKFYKAAIHFSGHSHNFERGTVEMQNSDLKLQHDMRELLSGGAGASLDRWRMYANQTDYPEVNKSLDVYSWTLIDVDVDDKSYTAKVFSFGHENVPANNTIIDEFHRKVNQKGPLKSSPAGVINGKTLVAAPMKGIDSAYTCHYQITSYPGVYVLPDVEVKQDIENWYGDSGAPNYLPINKNKNLDIKRYTIQTADGLTEGTTYGYRVRYRDQNLEWGDWSEEKIFVYQPTSISNTVDFNADTTIGNVGLKVAFSDLSTVAGKTWKWDFNDDGIIDSQVKDPIYQYKMSGMYTVKLTVNDGTKDYVVSKPAYVMIDQLTGIKNKIASNSNATIFPNPIKSSTQITFTLPKSDNVSVDLVDMNGNVVHSIHKGEMTAGKQEINWKSTVNAGVYLVKIKGSTIDSALKVVIE